MRYYYTTCDNGDGSSSLEFFESQEAIEFAEANWPETYGSGEGGGWLEGEILDSCYGPLSITTMSDLADRIADKFF